MTIRAIEIHPLAPRELRQAYRNYARRSPAAAQRFHLALQRVIQRIETVAEQGSPYGQAYQWMRRRRFPYFRYFQIRDPHPVLTYAVARASRRPGYWTRRTRRP